MSTINWELFKRSQIYFLFFNYLICLFNRYNFYFSFFSISAQSSSHFTVPFFRYQSIALVLSIDTRLFIGNKGHDICSASGGGIYHRVNGIFDLCIHIRCLSHYVSVPSDNVTVHLWDSKQKRSRVFCTQLLL